MRRWPGILLALIAVSACVWRLAHFTPQPLDSPGTLRPFFNAAYVAFLCLFRDPESAFAAWHSLCLVGVATPFALAGLTYFEKAGRVAGSRALFFGSMVLALIVCRFPTLIAYQLNPDEAEFLSAAQKLFVDLNFFRAVDCGTSGPFNIYPLMLPALFGISPDYCSSRLIALLVAFFVIVLFYRTVCFGASERLARIAVLPLFVAFAGLHNANLVHYSSEQIPLLWIALAVWAAVRVMCCGGNHSLTVFLLGVLVSLGFFSKMQSVPILLAIGAICVVYLSRNTKWHWYRHPLLLFVLGMMPVSAAVVGVTAQARVLNDFWFTYLVANHRYASEHPSLLRELPAFFIYLVTTAEIRSSLASALVVVALYCLALFRIRTANSKQILWFGILSLACVASALVSVYLPHRYFPHYLLFLLLPLSLILAWMLIQGSVAMESARFPALFLITIFAGHTYLWVTASEYRFQNIMPTIRGPEGDLIRSLTRDNEKLFVWGWNADPYLSSGRPAATRDLNLFYLFLAPPEITSYYRQRLLQDLRESAPALFVDAVGPTSWFVTDPDLYGFQQFPDLYWFVASNYVFLGAQYGQGIYLRQDLVAERAAAFRPERCAAATVVCLDAPHREPDNEGALITVVSQFPEFSWPLRARFTTKFTPMAHQTKSAVVFQIKQGSGGVSFESLGDGRYRLFARSESNMTESQPIVCLAGKLAVIALEWDGDKIEMKQSGGIKTRLKYIANRQPAQLTVGSRFDGQRRFTGVIHFAELLDLNKSTGTK